MGVIASVVAAMTGGLATQAWAQDLTVKSPRATVSSADANDVRVIATFTNPGMYGVFLVSATSDAAERVEIRDGRKRDAVVKEVEVPAFGSLTLEPKGLHLRLVNPKRPLRAGARVSVTVTTDAQSKVTVAAVVAAAP
jgi:copper(I)-binding protein